MTGPGFFRRVRQRSPLIPVVLLLVNMTKKSDKARGICYKLFTHITCDSNHTYLDPGAIDDKVQALWTIQYIIHLISFVTPLLASAGNGHKLFPANQQLVAEQLN